MGGGSFEPENLLNWLFTQDWVAKSVSHMREFLIVSPFNFILGALVMVVVSCGWPALQLSLEVYFLSLRNPCSGRLSPPMVVLEVLVFESLVSFRSQGYRLFVKFISNILHFIQILGSYLTNMEVHKVTVIGINFIDLVFCEVFCVHPILNVYFFMGTCD